MGSAVQLILWNLVGILSPYLFPAHETSPGIHFLTLNSVLILYSHAYQWAWFFNTPGLELQGIPLPRYSYPSNSLFSFCRSPHFQGSEQFHLWVSVSSSVQWKQWENCLPYSQHQLSLGIQRPLNSTQGSGQRP